jgi:glycerol-3-phosphate dehydrogenase
MAASNARRWLSGMMKRDLARLVGKTYDVLIIGGGISGACIAWDATQRGLRVALLEKGDFGGATSFNSLKTVHGGLRYLQDADLRLMRKMVRERQALLHIAPHLVHPLPCIMPTYQDQLMRSKLVLGAALTLNDLLSFDRNRGQDPQKNIPNGCVLSRSACLRLLPGVARAGVSGGILWHDAQIYNSERLLLAFLQSATQAGAEVVNYVSVDGFLQKEKRVLGVNAADMLTGAPLQIQARIVVNAAGPWVDEVTSHLNGNGPRLKFHRSTAMNLVTRKIVPDYGVGFNSRYCIQMADGSVGERSRVLFMAPWRDYSIIGTLHAPYCGHPDDNWVTEKTVMDFIAEVNQAYPGANLKRNDVYQVHRGFLPAKADNSNHLRVKLVRAGQVYDHEQESDITGLITAVGVKYTTARDLAETTVDLVFQKLGQQSPPCRTRTTRLNGGQIERFSDFLAQGLEKRPPNWSSAAMQHLLYNYGSNYHQLFQYFAEDSCWQQPVTQNVSVTKAEVLHSIRAEMAQKLSDVVLRRTELGSAGIPDEAGLQTCAHIMARELRWDRRRIKQEIDAVYATYSVAASL